jgi:hypothetical protein
MENTKLILVYYISTVGIDPSDIQYYFEELQTKIAAQSVSEDTEIIFVPVIGETRIECINPKYITDSELIKEHERKMAELHEHLDNQLEQIPKSKNDE